jgi:hypothetical protein
MPVIPPPELPLLKHPVVSSKAAALSEVDNFTKENEIGIETSPKKGKG